MHKFLWQKCGINRVRRNLHALREVGWSKHCFLFCILYYFQNNFLKKSFKNTIFYSLKKKGRVEFFFYDLFHIFCIRNLCISASLWSDEESRPYTFVGIGYSFSRKSAKSGFSAMPEVCGMGLRKLYENSPDTSLL